MSTISAAIGAVQAHLTVTPHSVKTSVINRKAEQSRDAIHSRTARTATLSGKFEQQVDASLPYIWDVNFQEPTPFDQQLCGTPEIFRTLVRELEHVIDGAIEESPIVATSLTRFVQKVTDCFCKAADDDQELYYSLVGRLLYLAEHEGIVKAHEAIQEGHVLETDEYLANVIKESLIQLVPKSKEGDFQHLVQNISETILTKSGNCNFGVFGDLPHLVTKTLYHDEKVILLAAVLEGFYGRPSAWKAIYEPQILAARLLEMTTPPPRQPAMLHDSSLPATAIRV